MAAHRSNKFLAFLLVGLLLVPAWACSRTDTSPKWLQEKYGLTEVYADSVPMPDGSLRATIVPVTLEDGRRAHLIVPQRRSDYPVYLRDEEGLKPIVVDRSVDRDQFVRSRPVMVERTATQTPRYRRTRSLKKEIFIVGGSAAAGAAIGAVAGGKKGAGIGALSGGIAGLVYDLATRKKD